MTVSSIVRLFILILVSVIPFTLYGQYYDLGQDPASIRWRQIKTEHFRIVYPETFEPKAQQLVNTLNYTYTHGTKTLAFLPARVPFIIHSYNTEPNAVTAWAPKRVEIFTTPPQDSYAQDWLDQLALHEYRHVVQLDRANQGFTKVLSWFTGEQAASMVNGLFVPGWFLEGDAVCTETALSHSGRGRSPSFEMLLRSQVMQKGAYSYDKAAFGSYKSFVPNKYVLGYSLVANVRRNYGYQAWISALDEVARKPFILTPFNHGLKTATGSGKVMLYRQSMFELDSMWKYQESQTAISAYDILTPVMPGKYENYKYPYYLNDTLILAQLSGMDDITRFVVVGHDGTKKVVCTPGFLSAENYSVARHPAATGSKENKISSKPDFLIAWTETINDPRWEQRTYSVIMVYDSRTGKIHEVTRGSRYYAPAISDDGLTIVAVCADTRSRNSIVLIDVANGIVTDTLIASNSDFYMTPAWSGDGTRIVFTTLKTGGKCIQLFDSKSKAITTIVQPTFTEISNPVFAEDYVLFDGSYTGIENVYAVDPANLQILQVTSAKFGAFNANLRPDGRMIVYSDYSSSGYKLVKTDFSPSKWRSAEQLGDYSASLYKYLVKEETGIVDSTTQTNIPYPSQPYKKAAHVFNFHSWAPVYLNYMSGVNSAGISFLSQNDLSTAFTVVGYSYDMAENTGKVTADFSWKAWYPVIELNTSYGGRASYTGGDTSYRYTFNEAIISGGLSLPLLFTGGKYYKGLQFRLHSSLYNITSNNSRESDKLTGTIHSLDYSITAYRYIKQSQKDVYPRWGQTLSSTFRHSPFGDNDLGSIISVVSHLYFPGILLHHGIRVDLSLQQNDPGAYSYNNQILFPRGYLNVKANKIECFALNYKFPFAYPDLSLGPLAYFKRLKANLFYDGGLATDIGESWKLQSTGVEITADLHLLRFVFPFDIGYRFGYRPIEKQYFGDLLFSVNLSN